MMVSIKGTFQNGVVQPSEPITDREGQTVIITFVEEGFDTVAADSLNTDQAAGWDRLMQSIDRNKMDVGIEDMAHQHDHYLYGKPKQD
jgi:predicted DNA-binding antitoxin AbrB/MazE fold protein